ncbi:RNA 2',3'-cyclic phosphodiesterase [Chloroflexota bacterium]
MEQVRSFIAIELPEEIRLALARLQDRLKSGKQYPVKWVDPYSIHLTLKFLGDVSLDSVGQIANAMERAAGRISSFQLEIKGLGVFPNLRRVQIAWVGLSGNTGQLDQLQQRLESGLASLGFAPESRPFKPHLTLARLRDRALPDERNSFGQLITSTEFEVGHVFNVDSINLMKSQLTRRGAVYSLISSVPLRKPLSMATV